MATANDVLRERLKLLNEYIKDLLNLQSVDIRTYEETKLIHRTVERTLQLAVETCLDIGQHIISMEGFRAPGDNREVFIILQEEDVIPDDLLPKLEAMARFRNLIVHDYARINHSIVYKILQESLGDFDLFAKAIIRYGGL